MNPLNNNNIAERAVRPERIIQFGGGNFLRAFVDWMVDLLNERTDFNGGVVIVKPTRHGDYHALNEQDGLFHVLVRGIENNELVEHTRLVKCVNRTIQPYHDYRGYLKLAEIETMRFIVSNTTEAGIVFNQTDKEEDHPANSFPGKLTQLLYHRFQHFSGAPDKGFIILPCELIENNGDQLKKYVLQYARLWELEDDFIKWIETANTFCNTLVDRIVTGFPEKDAGKIQEQIGYQDKLMTATEPYYVWVIEDDHRKVAKELPSLQARLNIQFVNDLTKHRTLKVRILNGAHTAMVPVGYFNGLETVRESIEDQKVGTFIKELIHDDILPTLEYPEAEKVSYAQSVLDRFKNPFIEHRLKDIALNSIAKFKTRLLPSLEWYSEKNERLPEHLLKALAALITFYKGEWEGQPTPLNDDQSNLQFFQEIWRSGKNTKTIVLQALKEKLNGSVHLPPNLETKVAELIEKKSFILKNPEN